MSLAGILHVHSRGLPVPGSPVSTAHSGKQGPWFLAPVVPRNSRLIRRTAQKAVLALKDRWQTRGRRPSPALHLVSPRWQH